MTREIQTLLAELRARSPRAIGRAISIVEDGAPAAAEILAALEDPVVDSALVVGVTGPGGAGKSTLTQALITCYRAQGRRVGVVAIDPSSTITGGALLGDRIRMMRHAVDEDVVIRSMATRGRRGGLCAAAGAAVRVMAYSGCGIVVLETVGVGQAELDVVGLADLTALVLAPGLGDDVQAMKAGLIELVDAIVVNKADQPAAEALAAEMEAIAAATGRAVYRTCAVDGRGVTELADGFEALAAALRESGQIAERRRRARGAEVTDWALEMLRPKVAEGVEALGSLRGDPRALARELIARLLARKDEP
ncbi:MAG: methylmalonyl Co-A mutase-associated GTPase MeaB [Proteobacteria bacterium]|nr:methylmalonyl Co-A mutase-associated GTPase MeaB [Pseudomonadota bacterium]